MSSSDTRLPILLRYVTFWVLTVAVHFPQGVGAKDLLLQLSDDWTAEVSTSEAERTLKLSLYHSESLIKSVTLGNASFNAEDVKSVVLCEDCSPSFFIPAWDRSSTYGATTGFVLWDDSRWHILTLPFDVAGIDGPDERGLTWLTDAQNTNQGPEVKRFRLKQGILLPEARLEFGMYGTDPALLSAVASGLSKVTPCDGPIEFTESRDGDTVKLNIHCDGSLESEANVIIEFTDYGEFTLVNSFRFAG